MATVTHPALKHLDRLAKLMDAQFRIPGTSFRFGLDPIIGLIPGGGDFAGLLISGYMLLVLAQNGASGFLLARMVLNVLIDATIGSIPIIGDLFDFAFKSNQRNMQLMHEHYVEGRHRGSAWKLVLPLLLLLVLLVGAVLWAVYSLVKWVWVQL